jgi:hypothetical protein
MYQNMSKYSMQHPAFYYQAAAKYAINRRKTAATLCKVRISICSRLTSYQNVQESSTFEVISKTQSALYAPYNPASIDLNNQVYIGQLPQDKAHPLEQGID